MTIYMCHERHTTLGLMLMQRSTVDKRLVRRLNRSRILRGELIRSVVVQEAVTLALHISDLRVDANGDILLASLNGLRLHNRAR